MRRGIRVCNLTRMHHIGARVKDFSFLMNVTFTCLSGDSSFLFFPASDDAFLQPLEPRNNPCCTISGCILPQRPFVSRFVRPSFDSIGECRTESPVNS